MRRPAFSGWTRSRRRTAWHSTCCATVGRGGRRWRREMPRTNLIVALVEASGQFDADGVAHVRSTVDSHLAGRDDGLWVTAERFARFIFIPLQLNRGRLGRNQSSNGALARSTRR